MISGHLGLARSLRAESPPLPTPGQGDFSNTGLTLLSLHKQMLMCFSDMVTAGLGFAVTAL